MKNLSTQVCRKLSEKYYKQSINDLLDQRSDICRDTCNQQCLVCKCASQSKCDEMRKIMLDFVIERIKMSKIDQEE